MAARRRIFVVWLLEDKDDKANVMGISGSQNRAREMALEAHDQMHSAYPMSNPRPVEWDEDNCSGQWWIEQYWLDELVKGETL
jgi:hypothetical protein